jgi:hypothetical protein
LRGWSIKVEKYKYGSDLNKSFTLVRDADKNPDERPPYAQFNLGDLIFP